MTEHLIDRRQALRGAGVAAGGAAVGAFAFATPAAAHGSPDNGLTGSWLAVRQDDGATDTTQVVVSLCAGGVIISHDINPAGPPFTGTWTASDGRRIRATFWSGTAGQGPGQPGQTLRVQVRAQVRHGSLTGTYAFTVFDQAGGAVLDSGTGKLLNGKRIEP